MKHKKNRDRNERDEFFMDYQKGDDLSTEMISYSESEPQDEPPKKHGKKKKERAQKLSKKERKELRKHQAELEKQLVAEGKIAPRYRYIPRNNFARIFCVCLAFVFGFLAAFGVLVGGFALYGTKKNLKEVSEVAGFDYSAVFTDTAAELSALDLIVEIADKYQKGEMNSLQSYANYTPLVDTVIDAACEQLAEAGFNVNKSELLTVSFDEIGGWFQDNVVRAVTLAGFLGVKQDTDDLFLRAICFKETEDGETYEVTINEFMDDSSSIIGGIELEVLLETDGNSDAALRYLAYGSELDSQGNRRYVVGEDGAVIMTEPNRKKTINDLTDEDADLIGGAKLGDLIHIDENSSNLLQAIQSWTIDDLTKQSRIERLKIGQILERTESSNLISAISQWRISDLSDQNKINSLTLGDVLTIDDETSAKILVSLKDTRLGDFDNAIDTLRLTDILSEEDLEGNKILRNLKDSTLLSLSDDLSDVSVEAVFGNEMYSFLSMSHMKDKYNEAAEKAGVETIETGSYSILVEKYATNKTVSYELADIVPESITLEEGETIITEYRANDKTVIAGYFRGDELLSDVRKGTRKVTRGDETVTETYYYTETKTTVTPVYSWSVFDYDKGEGVPLEGDISDYEVQEDSYGYYYTAQKDGETVRVDLERKLTGYEGYDALNELGDIVVDGNAYRVYEEEGASYILLRTENVETHYYDPESGEIAQGEVTAHYFRSSDTERTDELDRYLSGIWYLLFGGDEPIYSMSVSILDINTTITDSVYTINNTPLSELWLHGLITHNPFKKFEPAYLTYENLNELTVVGMIQFIQNS